MVASCGAGCQPAADCQSAFLGCRRHPTRRDSNLPHIGTLLLLIALSSCQPAQEGHGSAIIGAVLIDGRGGPPLSDSIVVVSGDRITAAGSRSDIPLPAEADRVNGAGKCVVPALIDLCSRADLPRPASAEEGRALVERKPEVVLLGEVAPPVAEAVLETARAAGIPVAAQASTQAQARLLVDGGASALLGMIADTEDLDPVLLRRMRDLRIVAAPMLSRAGAGLDVAGRNTRRLFQAGVLIGLASGGGDPVHECELLSAAGVPALDVIVAATRNSALALHQAEQRGAIEPGKLANLLLLSANPGEDVRNLRQIALRMDAGKWIR
jgi:imidazolonepropionase-like amidohydrolase